jgi:hypothetical protein
MVGTLSTDICGILKADLSADKSVITPKDFDQVSTFICICRTNKSSDLLSRALNDIDVSRVVDKLES